jgi:hypothetical protein
MILHRRQNLNSNNRKYGMQKTNKQLIEMIYNVQGRVGVPILMYILGVPGFLVILAWLFFFRGR